MASTCFLWFSDSCLCYGYIALVLSFVFFMEFDWFAMFSNALCGLVHLGTHSRWLPFKPFWAPFEGVGHANQKKTQGKPSLNLVVHLGTHSRWLPFKPFLVPFEGGGHANQKKPWKSSLNLVVHLGTPSRWLPFGALWGGWACQPQKTKGEISTQYSSGYCLGTQQVFFVVGAL